MFFVFDGLDGAGKSTQLQLFGQFLIDQGIEVEYYRDPGSTELGNQMRELLLAQHGMPIDMRSELLMFMTARAQLTSELIQPALQSGKTVICDRYVLSTVVYQGYAGGLDPETVWQLNDFATGGLKADLTFVFDLDVDKSIERLGSSLDRMESRGRDYFEKLRIGFLTEAQPWPVGYEVIDADGTIEMVHQRILEAADAKLRKLLPT